MSCCINSVTTNVEGTPYIKVSNVTVTDTAVDFALGFRGIAPVGYFTVRVADAIPTGTTGTLPVTLTLNGVTRNLTYFNGVNVTAADITGTGVIMVFNDRFNGLLALMSPTTA